jgi:diguanylate cyclase (GGDEF)-like protein
VTTKEALVRVLLVGEAEEAGRIRRLLGSDDYGPIRIADVSDLGKAAEWFSCEDADILLLDMGPNRERGRAFVEAARAAAPDMPMVILSEFEDEEFEGETLRMGAQDILLKARMDRTALERSLRHSVERHHMRNTLRSLSLIDDLTGLNNRRGFMALAEQHLRVIQRKGAALMIYLDVDDLKTINDTYGHLEGNRALVVTANVLRACFRQSDILARLGGDEFCVLMTDAREDSAVQVRKRLQQRMDFINALSTWQYKLSWSIGIAEVLSVNQPSMDDLLRIADSRMYEEKRNKQVRGSFSLAFKQATIA